MPHDPRYVEILKDAHTDAPSDGYGAGFLAYQLRTTFRDLCRVVGFENAREEVAEIINTERERKTHG